MSGQLGLRAMVAFVALAALGFVLLAAGILSNDPTHRGVGILSAFCGSVLALFLAIRWLIYRGIGWLGRGLIAQK